MSGPRASAADAARLRELHRGPALLVLPNAWDPTSAATLAEAGFRAIATSSGAVARSLGYTDGEGTPRDEMFTAVARIVAAVAPDVAVTADIENGYRLEPPELVERLAAAGAAGCNLEDSDPRTRAMVPLEAQAERIAAVRRAADAAGTGLVVNARVDLHVRADGPEETRLERAVERARAYLAAGADCVFPIMLSDEAGIAAFVSAVPGPVNILAMRTTPGIGRLGELGVRRVSLGGGLHRIALDALRAAADRLAAGEDPWPS